MINQINSSVNKEVFAPLQSSDKLYAVAKPINKTQKEELKQEKEKTSNALGFSIATLAVVVGLGLFALMKGSSRSTRKNVNKMLDKLQEKSDEISHKAKLSDFEKFFLVALKKAKVFTNKSKALFNTAPLKDVVVSRVLKKQPFTKMIGDKITALFERISIKTSARAYRQTSAKLDKMYATFEEANKKMPKAKAKEIEKRMRNIKSDYNEGFSESARAQRLQRAKEGMKGIDDKVWDATYGDLKKFFTNKDTYEKFISEELASDSKIKLSKEVSAVRRRITNGKFDNYKATKKVLNNIESAVDPTDSTARALIKDIRKNLNQYKTLIDVKENTPRLILNTEISNSLGKLNSHISASSKYDKAVKINISEYVRGMNSALQQNQRGEIQQILGTYRQFLPEKEYLKIKQQANSASHSLDSSIDLEADKLFDKVRDLMIGAAPTDVVGVLSSLGIIGWGLSKADDNKQRVSVALKYGIPAIGAVMISLYCTIGLVSGGAALAIGTFSGLIMNKIGAVVDNAIKNELEAQEKKDSKIL
jgi:hypothetical protein